MMDIADPRLSPTPGSEYSKLALTSLSSEILSRKAMKSSDKDLKESLESFITIVLNINLGKLRTHEGAKRVMSSIFYVYEEERASKVSEETVSKDKAFCNFLLNLTNRMFIQIKANTKSGIPGLVHVLSDDDLVITRDSRFSMYPQTLVDSYNSLTSEQFSSLLLKNPVLITILTFASIVDTADFINLLETMAKV